MNEQPSSNQDTGRLHALFHVAEAYRSSTNLDHDKGNIVFLVDEIARVTKERDDLHAMLHNVALHQEKQAQSRAVETTANLNAECLSCGQRYEAIKGHKCAPMNWTKQHTVTGD